MSSVHFCTLASLRFTLDLCWLGFCSNGAHPLIIKCLSGTAGIIWVRDDFLDVFHHYFSFSSLLISPCLCRWTMLLLRCLPLESQSIVLRFFTIIFILELLLMPNLITVIQQECFSDTLQFLTSSLIRAFPRVTSSVSFLVLIWANLQLANIKRKSLPGYLQSYARNHCTKSQNDWHSRFWVIAIAVIASFKNRLKLSHTKRSGIK